MLFTIELIDYNLSRFQDLEDYMIEILQEIEWSNLTKRLQNYLSLKIEGLNFKIIEKTTSHLKIISNEINDRKSQLIFSKGKIIGTEKCIISKIKPLEVLYELIVIQRRKAESFLSDFKIIEIIRLDQVFIFDVIGARISNTNNLVITITQNSPTFIETYQTFNGCKVYQDMKLIGLINSIQTKTSKKILEVNGEIESLEIKDDNLSVNMNSNFILKMLSDSEIRRLKIHPFEIKNSPESMSILLNKLTFNPDNIINFLLKNKLINYFLSKQFYPLNFGLIIAKKEIKLHTIYFVTTKDVVEMKTRNKGNVGDIVVLDNDKKMHKINLNKSVRNFIGFKIGRIINYNDKKGEGFISVKDDSYQGDYFFSKHYTDLIPTVGDKVEFIAIPNPIDRYKGKMVALNITMAENT